MDDERPPPSPRRSIQVRIALFLALAALLSYGGGTLVVRHAIVPAFEEIERRTAADEASRVKRAIDEDAAGLHRIVNDWAVRDDVYDFVRAGGGHFTIPGLDRTLYDSLDVDVIVYLDPAGKPLWAWEHARGELRPAPPGFVETLRAAMPIFGRGAKGVLVTDDSMPALAAFRAVAPAGERTAPMGAVGMLRRMDLDYVVKLSRRLNTRVRLEPNADGHAGPPELEFGADTIRARLPMYDIFLRHGLTIDMDVPRQFVPTMARAFSRMNLLMSAVAVLTAVLLWMVLRREVLSPIRRIARRIRESGRDGGDGPRRADDVLGDLPVGRADEVGEIAAGIVFLHDRILDLASRDALTGIPTRRPFADRAEHAIRRAERLGSGFAVLVLDLDGFKPVNDTFGHAAGDAVLRAVAERITATLRGSDTVARVGGDEFAVLLEDAADRENAAVVADKLSKAIRAPVAHDGRELLVGASIGIAVYPADGTDLDTLLRVADQAMYAAKPRRRGAYARAAVS